MIRMEVALFLVMAMIAWFYFSTPRIHSALHDTFSILLVSGLCNLLMDGITVYTVNHLDTIPLFLNDMFHRLFIGTMVITVYLFYQYISELIQEEADSRTFLDTIARVFLIIFETGVLILPIHYAVTPAGNYSDGIHANLCYISVGFYLLLCVWLLIRHGSKIRAAAGLSIGVAMGIELVISLIQGMHPEWLISGAGVSLMILTFYLTLENPEKLRNELEENRMSMLYLRSQINPHFLYNTLDTIRIQAQLNGDAKTAQLLMRLVDFFRLSVKSSDQMVTLEHESEMIDAYMELMCCRYPNLHYEYNCDEEYEDCLVPNFILQPLVENSLKHGLKNKGYQGTIRIETIQKDENTLEIQIHDDGQGFDPEKLQRIEKELARRHIEPGRARTRSIGILNVQNRIRLLCGKEYGLSYTSRPDEGVITHITLPLMHEEEIES
ncbi:MAG: sensor histidine kinase [Bulleidia sp.]